MRASASASISSAHNMQHDSRRDTCDSLTSQWRPRRHVHHPTARPAGTPDREEEVKIYETQVLGCWVADSALADRYNNLIV
eukprot:scaffold40681_cov30-Tisochrysis_lutea.AAC.1